MYKCISNLLNKYKSMPVPAKAALWFAVCNFLQRGIGMLTTPVFTRILPTEEYGLYSTYLSWETVLLMIVTLCLSKSMMNLYVHYDDHEKILSEVCGLEICLSSCWLLVGILFKDKIAGFLKLTPTLVICLFVYFMFQAAIQCWSLYKTYKYEYHSLVAVTLVSSFLSSILGVCFVVFINPTAESRAIANSLVTALTGLLLYFAVFRKSRSFYNGKVWSFALGFCIPLMPHYLSEFILQSSDKIMINYMCGSEATAIYSIAYSTGSLITLITSAVNSSFAPYQYQKIKERQYDQLARRANQVLFLISVILTFIMLFGREIVLVFGGTKYLESASVIIPICLGVYFNYVFQLFARVQEYYEHKATVAIPSILCAILNLISNYIFINMYGYRAAAYTTFFCYLIFCILHYFFYRKVCVKELDGQQLYNIKGIVLISVLVIGSGIIISFINRYGWIKYSLSAIVIVAFVMFRRKLLQIVKEIMTK